jgi:hypothetical protein
VLGVVGDGDDAGDEADAGDKAAAAHGTGGGVAGMFAAALYA